MRKRWKPNKIRDSESGKGKKPYKITRKQQNKNMINKQTTVICFNILIHLEIWYTIKTVKYCILNTMLALSHELNVHKYVHRFILIESGIWCYLYFEWHRMEYTYVVYITYIHCSFNFKLMNHAIMKIGFFSFFRWQNAH